MAANTAISIGFIVQGANGLQELAVNADALRQVMGATVTEAEKLHKSLINYAAIGNTINHVVNAIGEIHQVLGELTGAYNAQIEAETKLAVNMRNTMSATDEEIQRIKDLSAAQQDLGVVGDEALRAAVLCGAVSGIISSKTKSPPLKIAEAIKGCE